MEMLLKLAVLLSAVAAVFGQESESHFHFEVEVEAVQMKYLVEKLASEGPGAGQTSFYLFTCEIMPDNVLLNFIYFGLQFHSVFCIQ